MKYSTIAIIALVIAALVLVMEGIMGQDTHIMYPNPALIITEWELSQKSSQLLKTGPPHHLIMRTFNQHYYY